MPRTFTRDELREFNGRDRKPADVAFKGKFYDVTDGPSWDDGDHFWQHQAGMDLTEEMEERRTVMKYLPTNCLSPFKTVQMLGVRACL